MDWVADYFETVGALPVMPRMHPGDLRAALPPHAPESAEPFDGILDDFERLIVPAVTHWNHPAFFGYFPSSGSGPGVVGELLAAALNTNAMVWKSSPAGTELEEHVIDWLRELVGLPAAFRGSFTDTASISSLHALAAAREAALPEAERAGLHGAPRGRVYASEEAHSSIAKAVVTLGFGRDGLRKIPTDVEFALRPDALRAALAEDAAAGIRPVAVVATVGTTSSTAVDPVAAVADVARAAGVWLHVDAAYAGPAAMLPEMSGHFAGWERADSVVLNPHKWLFTPVDCSILWCSRPDELRRAFSLVPEYLRTAEGRAGATDLMEYGIALGRRFRALKLWMVLRGFGADGLRARLRAHVAMAAELAAAIDREPGWERVAPHPFSLVVFRWAPAHLDGPAQDAANERILEAANRGGQLFLSHTRLGGRTCLRVAIGNVRTTPAHVERAWDVLRAAAAGSSG